MALIIIGETKCAICGNVLEEGQDITGLPAASHYTHPLYKYFDTGFHLKCFENWDKKDEIKKIIKADREDYKNSDYFKEMEAKYGYPKWIDEEPF
jgi:hypothetical protein